MVLNRKGFFLELGDQEPEATATKPQPKKAETKSAPESSQPAAAPAPVKEVVPAADPAPAPVAAVAASKAESKADTTAQSTEVAPKAESSKTTAEAIAAELAVLDIDYLDAPISGGSVKAAAGEMTIMASGPSTAFAKARSALDALARHVFEVGTEPGQGSQVKLVNQLLAGVHIAAAAEAMAYGIQGGCDPNVLYEVITQSAGNSWMFENRVPHILAGDYNPHSAVDIFVKDLGIVAATGQATKFPLPMTAQALTMFTQASAMGYGREDDAGVIRVFPGVDLPARAANDEG